VRGDKGLVSSLCSEKDVMERSTKRDVTAEQKQDERYGPSASPFLILQIKLAKPRGTEPYRSTAEGTVSLRVVCIRYASPISEMDSTWRKGG
jgi:hypothetical protein